MPDYDFQGEALESYRGSVQAPADFDAFWAATLKEAQAFPLNATFEAHDCGLNAFDVFDLAFSGFGGHRVRGWFLLPKGSEGKLPLVVRYVGYGGGRGYPYEHLVFPAAGYAHLVMDTRGQGSAWTPGDTPDPVGSDPAHPGYMTRGILSRETYYYRRVFTDAVRAIEAGRSHARVDGARVSIVGGSQGGGICLAAAALSPHVAAMMPDVPYLCDFPRAVRVAQRDPYLEIARFLSVHRGKVGAVFETLRYFDGTCFAERIKTPALVSAASMDTICPPSTVHAAFNRLASADKTIVDYGFNDHEGGGLFQQGEQLTWLRKRLG